MTTSAPPSCCRPPRRAAANHNHWMSGRRPARSPGTAAPPAGRPRALRCVPGSTRRDRSGDWTASADHRMRRHGVVHPRRVPPASSRGPGRCRSAGPHESIVARIAACISFCRTTLRVTNTTDPSHPIRPCRIGTSSGTKRCDAPAARGTAGTCVIHCVTICNRIPCPPPRAGPGPTRGRDRFSGVPTLGARCEAAGALTSCVIFPLP